MIAKVMISRFRKPSMVWILVALFTLLAIEQFFRGNYAKATYWTASAVLTLSVHWMK
jgi:hypothetical protein